MDSEVKILLAKAKDLVRIRNLRNIPKFSGFLTPSEAALILSSLKEPGCCFFGGYPDAQRCMFGALPEYITEPFSEFPIKALKITYRKVDILSHRDFLGSFMATGISRDRIGDIRVGEGIAFAYVTQEIALYLAKQITKIGKVGVATEVISVGEVEDILPKPKTLPLKFTVSSLRLDAVLSGLTGCSRTKSEKYISEGLVFVNSFEVTKATKQIKCGDRITLRGVGKFVITQSGEVTKKGREIVVAEKYI